MKSPKLAGKKLVFAPILRAGLTFAEGMLDLVPAARVAHIGLYREPETFSAVEYFFKAPSDIAERLVIVIVPVLATANTAVAAVDRLKERGAKDVRLVCMIARAGRARADARHSSRCPCLDRGHRRGPQRTGLYRARAWAMPATAPTAQNRAGRTAFANWFSAKGALRRSVVLCQNKTSRQAGRRWKTPSGPLTLCPDDRIARGPLPCSWYAIPHSTGA